MMKQYARNKLIGINNHNFDIMICIYDRFDLKFLAHGFTRLYVVCLEIVS